MPAIQRLLERWGFIKLGRYGLSRTRDGRILSMRPAVLDDGAGGRVVGWRDDDLAMAQLKRWTGATQPPIFAQLRAAPSGPAMPVVVAPDAPVDEDDWEWTIALARARAAAEEAEMAEPPLAKTREMPAVTMQELASSCEPTRPAPARSESIDYEDYSAVTTRPGMVALASLRAPAPATAPHVVPSTVIPVPRLPSIHTTNGVTRLEPVVRTAQVPPASPNRFPKGTATVSPRQDSRAVMSDDTDPNVSVGDRTTPGIAMPPAARAVALPSIKRTR